MISQRGLKLIKAHEGLRLKAYDDGTGVQTIGYGHTQGVQRGQTITKEQAEAFLREDIDWVEDAIRQNVKVPLNENKHDALASLIFNIGAGAFKDSTLLRKLNAGDYEGAGQEFIRWNKAAGSVNAGLTNRRHKEAALFNAPAPIEMIEIPKEKPTMALPAILAALLPSLIDAVPKLAGIFKPGSPVAERNVQVASMAFDIAKTALSASNEQEVIERIKADPAAAATVAKAIENNWFQLVEVGGGIEAARKAETARFQSGQQFWLNPSFWVSVALLAMPFMLLVDVFYVHPESYQGDIRTQIVTAVLVVISMVGAYWIGTSASSAKKDEARASGGA